MDVSRLDSRNRADRVDSIKIIEQRLDVDVHDPRACPT